MVCVVISYEGPTRAVFRVFSRKSVIRICNVIMYARVVRVVLDICAICVIYNVVLGITKKGIRKSINALDVIRIYVYICVYT